LYGILEDEGKLFRVCVYVVVVLAEFYYKGQELGVRI
jgi:hypothetical protein